MAREGRKNPEFRRYRQFLITVYFTVIAAGVLLLATSVMKELFFHKPTVTLRGPRLDRDNPDPAALVRCNEDVQGLFRSLGTTAATLMEAPLSGSRRDPWSRWRSFSRQWKTDWDEVDARCRFSELTGTGLGPAYDRMAQVHSDLPAMRLKYQSLLVRFDDEQAAELVRMRSALESSQQDLAARVPRNGADAPVPSKNTDARP